LYRKGIEKGKKVSIPLRKEPTKHEKKSLSSMGRLLKKIIKEE